MAINIHHNIIRDNNGSSGMLITANAGGDINNNIIYHNDGEYAVFSSNVTGSQYFKNNLIIGGKTFFDLELGENFSYSNNVFAGGLFGTIGFHGTNMDFTYNQIIGYFELEYYSAGSSINFSNNLFSNNNIVQQNAPISILHGSGQYYLMQGVTNVNNNIIGFDSFQFKKSNDWKN